MKNIIFLILIIWNIGAFVQSVILADPFQSVPSNLHLSSNDYSGDIKLIKN